MRTFANDNTPSDIDRIDEVLCEDDQHVMFTGHTPDESVVYIASVDLPAPIDPATFSGREWLNHRNLHWTRHEGVQ
ncbi:hypothetical protein [Mesorhizobium qingshengii]|uniref:Uncharacterized protein n=1 Tax=Mesorhizobium qingshengii TaxID=1165689 RepID=A0A1G5V3S6_9HYPH|nr:hypothetical protein [Mesorhizobium qingshengii]SDA40288.1 hypothetical protein SAMN02927914_00223 [Mesorhizobium qingshengii]